jgi:hypothetical protein
MFTHEAQTLPGRKKTPNKLIAGFAAFITTGIITASGFAAAATTQTNKPPGQDNCKKASASSMEKKECEKVLGASKIKQKQNNGAQMNTIGHGYGGGNTSVAANINLALNNSNNNVFNIIFNIFR